MTDRTGHQDIQRRSPSTGAATDARSTLDAEAAGWLIRLEGGPLDRAERAAFEAWLAQGPAKEAALWEAREAWNELGRLAPAPAISNDNRPFPVRRRAVGAVTASLVLAVGLTIGLETTPLGNAWTSLTTDHHTGYGEIRSVRLPDGSRAELDSDTALLLHYDERKRAIELVKGEAVFTVTPAERSGHRPFVVESAGGEARALGTRFLVARRDGETRVTVLEHSVAVSLKQRPGGTGRVVLQEGQQVAYARNGGLSAIATVEPEAAAPWRDGRLVFDRVPLSDAVATLDRYRRSRTVVLGEALAARRVSGVFNLDQLDSALDIIAAELEARSVALPPFVTLLY